ncbi:hypothetical protein VIBNISFn118_1310001 [Vibrio nigripulchritudo SFn118]|nr:hypothetical protein VIBNISFn118_1310001 [Vibrio nigripulchritudo SFn118]
MFINTIFYVVNCQLSRRIYTYVYAVFIPIITTLRYTSKTYES